MDLDHEEVIGQTLVVLVLMVHYCWSTTVDYQLSMDLDTQELTAQLLMEQGY